MKTATATTFVATRRFFLVQTIQRQFFQSLHTAIVSANLQNPAGNRVFGGIDHLKHARSLSSYQRRRRQQQRRQRVQEKVDADLTKEISEEKPIPVKPWWRYITIWPDPHGYDPEFERQQRFPRPQSAQQFREALDLSVKDYRWSHEGWLLPESEETDANGGTKEKLSTSDRVEAQRKQINTNVAKNVKFLRAEGPKALEEVQKRTGIYSLQDLKEWTALQLQLATECVHEFMAGYREGRDDEVEKMMNQYFQGMWEDEEAKPADGDSKQKRRKPKRRIRSAV